jgi:hypothetical protein
LPNHNFGTAYNNAFSERLSNTKNPKAYKHVTPTSFAEAPRRARDSLYEMSRIEHERLSGVTYEQELEILAEIYRLALKSYQNRKKEAARPAPEPDGRNAAKESTNACDATRRIPE